MVSAISQLTKINIASFFSLICALWNGFLKQTPKYEGTTKDVEKNNHRLMRKHDQSEYKHCERSCVTYLH